MSGFSNAIAKLERLASPAWLGELARRQSERTLDLIDNGFRDKVSPYREPWQVTKQKNPILERTGAFRREWHPDRISSAGFSIVSGVFYGGFHQTGTAKMVARKVAPDASRGLGGWQEPLDKVAADFVVETMK